MGIILEVYWGPACRYMAPEVLECSVGPPADVWAAGVMAYQLLSGYLPFDDRANPRAPAVSKIWCASLPKTLPPSEGLVTPDDTQKQQNAY